MDIFGSVTGAINAAGKVKEIADKFSYLELKDAIIDLREKLQDVREQCLNFRQENEDLKAEVKRLSSPPEMYVKNQLYYKKVGDDGPFCPGCFDGEKKPIRLVDDISIRGDTMGRWRCPVCKNNFKDG